MKIVNNKSRLINKRTRQMKKTLVQYAHTDVGKIMKERFIYH